MLEWIEKKILEIRQEPEPVRMRYLLLCLGVTMAFVILIWIFSLQESVHNISRTQVTLPTLPDTETSLESLRENQKALGVPSKEGVETTNLFQKEDQQ